MFDYINNFLAEQLQWLNIPYFGPADLFEIIIIAFTVYFLAKSLIDTRIWIVVKGLLYLLIAYGIFVLFNMQVLAQIFLIFIVLCLIGIVIALQPEIKKLLEQTGSKDYFKNLFNFMKKDKQVQLTFQDKTLNALVDACENMSETKTGALIVFELDTPLEDIIATGQRMDAIVQKALLIQTFVKNTPLHDGAMVIKGDRIDSATCYLPLSENTKISKDLGTRHRAGIGVTEQVNCFVLIVQEETGAISWAENGRLRHKVSLKELRQKLTELQHRKDVNFNKKKKGKKDSKSNEKLGKSLEKKLLHNFREKVLAVVCQCLIWITVLNFINPNTTRRFQDIPVKPVNTDVLNQQEQTYDIVQGNTAQIIVKGRRSIVDSLDLSDITAKADFTNINAAYAVPIDIEISEQYSDNVEISYQSTKSMKVELDTIAETLVDVQYHIVGEQASGSYVSAVTQDVSQLRISGPNKLISTIDKVELEVNVDGVNKQFDTTAVPKIYDRNGALIDNQRLTLSESNIEVHVEVLKTKQVPVKVSVVNQNEDIRIISTSYDSSKSVQLAGQSDSLEDITELSIEVDVSEDLKQLQQSKLVKVIDLNEYLSNGVQVAGDQKMNISVDIERKTEKYFSLQANQIQLQNLRDGYNAQIDQSKTYDITVIGFENDLKDLTVQQIAPYVDLQGLRQGDYELQIEINPSTASEALTLKEDIKALVTIERVQ